MIAFGDPKKGLKVGVRVKISENFLMYVSVFASYVTPL
jgi:hypothetical protein